MHERYGLSVRALRCSIQLSLIIHTRDVREGFVSDVVVTTVLPEI
jgi:hypothetical protein